MKREGSFFNFILFKNILLINHLYLKGKIITDCGTYYYLEIYK